MTVWEITKNVVIAIILAEALLSLIDLFVYVVWIKILQIKNAWDDWKWRRKRRKRMESMKLEDKEFLTRTDIEGYIGKGKAAVRGIVDGIEAEIEKGRYKRAYSILKLTSKIELINKLVLIDYLQYARQLKDANARRYVPPYNPMEVAIAIGLQARKNREG